jgi:hypothetical protein
MLGLASLLNDIASEMIFPLLPHFLLTVLLGTLPASLIFGALYQVYGALAAFAWGAALALAAVALLVGVKEQRKPQPQ